MTSFERWTVRGAPNHQNHTNRTSNNDIDLVSPTKHLISPTQGAHQIGLIKLVVVRVGRGDVELQELYLPHTVLRKR